MIFLDEDLIKNRNLPIDDETTISEDLLSMSEATNDFITESLNSEINYQQNLMEAVYLESNDDKEGAIKKFFNGVINFVKKVWNSIKGFFTRNKEKTKTTSEKLVRVIKVVLNDKRFKKALNSEVRVKDMKISIEASKLLFIIGPTRSKKKIINHVYMKDLMDTLQKKAKDVNKITAYSSDKLYRNRTLKKVQLLNKQFNSLVVETSDEAFAIYPKEFLEGFLTVATSAFDTNFNNLIKNLQNANQQLEKVAQDALKNTSDPKLSLVRKEQSNIFKNNVSVFNKCVAKLTLYHHAYITNTYKIVSVVRSLK